MKLDPIYQAILDNVQELVYVRDLDMNIAYINRASEELTGWTLKEALGQKCYEIFGDKALTCKNICPAEKVLSNCLPSYNIEGRLKIRSGDERDMKVSISPILKTTLLLVPLL